MGARRLCGHQRGQPTGQVHLHDLQTEEDENQQADGQGAAGEETRELLREEESLQDCPTAAGQETQQGRRRFAGMCDSSPIEY